MMCSTPCCVCAVSGCRPRPAFAAREECARPGARYQGASRYDQPPQPPSPALWPCGRDQPRCVCKPAALLSYVQDDVCRWQDLEARMAMLRTSIFKLKLDRAAWKVRSTPSALPAPLPASASAPDPRNQRRLFSLMQARRKLAQQDSVGSDAVSDLGDLIPAVRAPTATSPASQPTGQKVQHSSRTDP